MAIDDKSRRAYHPAVSISNWLIVAMAIELASPTQLQWFVVLAAFLLVGGGAQRFAQLMWRARWLWLALVCLYAWTVPGTLLWPSEYSPSIEGLQAGLVRIARLALMLAALARLLSELTAQQLAHRKIAHHALALFQHRNEGAWFFLMLFDDGIQPGHDFRRQISIHFHKTLSNDHCSELLLCKLLNLFHSSPLAATKWANEPGLRLFDTPLPVEGSRPLDSHGTDLQFRDLGDRVQAAWVSSLAAACAQ